MGASYSTYMDSRSYLHAAEAGELDVVNATLATLSYTSAQGS